MRAAGAPARAWRVAAGSGDVSYRFEAGATGWQDVHDPLVRLFAVPQDGPVRGPDLVPPDNTSVSGAAITGIDLQAPDVPGPGDRISGQPRAP